MERSPFRRWTRLAGFLREVREELAKVIWPTRSELVTYSIVVVVTVVVLGSFIYVLDQLFARLIIDLFGR
jgi:preprotein translocase subunit SecE